MSWRKLHHVTPGPVAGGGGFTLRKRGSNLKIPGKCDGFSLDMGADFSAKLCKNCGEPQSAHSAE